MVSRAARTNASRVAALSIGLVLALGADATAAISPGGWDHLGDGGAPNTSSLNGRVDALYAAAPDALYAGGVFTSAGGDATASYIARWDGSAWHAIGAPALNGDVDAIAVEARNVYVGRTTSPTPVAMPTPTSSRSGTASAGSRSAIRSGATSRR